MRRITKTIIAKSNQMWMKPPIAWEVRSPRSHKRSKAAKIVPSIRILSQAIEINAPVLHREV
jgi:hypothetical protein